MTRLEPPILHNFLRSRRSVRRFKDQPVPRALIERLIATASFAPSAHNRQPWRFVVLRSQESRRDLADAMGVEFHRTLRAEGLVEDEAAAQVARSRQRITQAPSALLICLDTSTLDHYDDANREHGELTMAVQSVAMAGAYLLLAAHTEGLGAVWICAPLFTPKIAQKVLELPSSWLPQGMILLGYPAFVPAPRPVPDEDEFTIFKE